MSFFIVSATNIQIEQTVTITDEYHLFPLQQIMKFVFSTVAVFICIKMLGFCTKIILRQLSQNIIFSTQTSDRINVEKVFIWWS
jgi:hypothetical protein